VYSDAGMTETDVAAWERERRACVVGGALAEQYAWSVGDRVELHSTVPPYLALEFRVVKIMTNPSKANFFFFRRDYLEESRKEAGSEDPICNVFWVKCHSVKDLRWLQVEIDRLFAGTSEATKTEDESAFGSRFTQAAGDIPSLMQAMAVVVVVIIALVAGNTMMMSFRERTRELAVFKAIGFASGRIFAIVLGESVLLALIGALIGIVPTAAILLWYPVRRLGFGPITSLEVSSFAVIASFVIALTIGLVSGLWPAIQSLRLQTTDALRRVA
ncbi:MAG: ABC transporter permease, partial [Planctomycetota bacterium]|nr:ABC transporter permease [Planctomycetota bacterium]